MLYAILKVRFVWVMLVLCFVNLLGNRGIGILPRNLGAEEDVCKGLGGEAMVRRRENYVLIS